MTALRTAKLEERDLSHRVSFSFFFVLFCFVLTSVHNWPTHKRPPPPPVLKILFSVLKTWYWRYWLFPSKQKLELQRKHEMSVWRIKKIIKCITRVTVIVDILITYNVFLWDKIIFSMLACMRVFKSLLRQVLRARTRLTISWMHSPTAIPLSVITNLSILCFSGQHVSELHVHHFYVFKLAPERFPRAVLLFSYRA